MQRRKFLKTSAGLIAIALADNVYSVILPESKAKPVNFRPYRHGQSLAPVMQITPDDGFYVHTFYDECPWSPNQRYLAVSKLPYQEKKPQWGDTADVCVIDLENQTIRTLYTTQAWSFQVGTNAQWDNVSNRYLYTNDIIDGKPVCVRLDLENNTAKAFSGPKYDVAPDGQSVAGPDLRYVNITQYGYAVPDPPDGEPNQFTKEQMDSEGLWKTDLVHNKTRLLASMNDFYSNAVPEDQRFYKNGVYYTFHSKYNSKGTRIMQVFRCLFEGKGRHASLFTLNTDGSDIIQCLTREQWNQKARLGGSGNHPNWHPDGEHIIMNTIPTWLGFKDMMLSMFKYDGSDFKILTDRFMGSGHPSIEPNSRFVVTDAYTKQTYVVNNEEIPIRLIDLEKDAEHILCTISNNVGNEGKMYSDEGGSQFKLDPHPTWSRYYKSL